jgi:lipopolysaccharide biosynthesis regulator YciM
MSQYLPLLAALIALLVGLVVGKAWERYKLRDGRWIDRRRLRETPHYMLGLNFLTEHHVDQAIEELTAATSTDTDALEIQMILGNLYRQKGQVARAITVHQALLQRTNLTRLEHAYVLLCLGLDFKRGGFVDRALEAFKEVLRFDPSNRYALGNLQKLYEEQHQWAEAYDVRRQLAALEEPAAHARTAQILAFLENELGVEAVSRGDQGEAGRRFQAAIDLDATTVPAYLHLGDMRLTQEDPAGAAAAWERVLDVAPDRAYLAFDRLQAVYPDLQQPDRFADLCRLLASRNAQDWRARLALARHLASRGDTARPIELLFEALAQNPHALVIHEAIWTTLASLGAPAPLIDRYLTLTREVVFYLDPHICTRCRYRSTELLWQCPQCHEWNTFVEERMATARDQEASG